MTIEILMPALSPTMTEGTLAKWHVAAGERVEQGDVIAEVETDKAIMEIEADADGVMGEILVAAGTADVQVGTLIARMQAGDAPARSVAAPTAAQVASQPVGLAPAPTPLARREAERNGLDLTSMAGSGGHGRVTREDVVRAAQPAVVAAPLAVAPAGEQPFNTVPVGSMRAAIARRMVEAKAAPHFYLEVDCRMDALLAVRKQLKERHAGLEVSINDFLIRALALSLKQVPEANVQWAGDRILHFGRVDIAVAVALDSGLITPLIRDAGSKGVREIASEMRELAERARQGGLKPEEYQGGSFSLSNLGMFGMKAIQPILNPPQAGIIGVGAAERRPWVEGDELVVATVMTATLSADHRVLDGATGARLLARFKALLENPLDMLL